MMLERDPLSAAVPAPLTILDALPAAVAVIDEHHKLHYANAEFHKLLALWPQCERTAELGASYLALAGETFAASDLPALESAIQMVMMGVSRIELEYSYLQLNQQCSLALTLRPVALGAEQPGGVLIQHCDITAHKLSSPANDYLRSQYERAMLMLNAAGEGIFTLDRDGKITFVNPAVLATLDWEAEELIGKYYTKVVQRGNQLDSGAELTPIRSALGEGLTSTVDTRCFWRKDGAGVPVEFTCAPIRNQKEEIDGAVVTFKDISDRKEAEAHQRRLVAILDATTDMVSISNMDGQPMYLNHAGRRMMGLGDDDDISQTVIPDYHPEWALRKVSEEGIPTAIRDGWWIGETALLSREGREIPLSQVIMAHRDSEGNLEFLSTVGRNLSLLKQSEEMLRASIAQEAMLRAHETMINEISVPLLKLRDQLLLLPLIGSFNPQRTQYLSATLAESLPRHLGAQLIVDLSSQNGVDACLAAALHQVILRSAGLVSVRLAGLRPEFLPALQSHDLDLTEVPGDSTLQDALQATFLG